MSYEEYIQMENWTSLYTLTLLAVARNISRLYMLQPLEINRFETCKVSPTNISSAIITRYDDIITDDNLDTMKTVFGVVLLLPVCILGIVGNALCLVVLCHQSSKTATIYCLIGLAISDLMLLFNGFLFSIIVIYVNTNPIEGNNFRSILFPYFGMYTSIVSGRITSMLTMLISMERFVAVHFPMKAKTICSKKTTLIAIIVIYIVTIILFLPYPFKYQVVHTVKNNISYAIVARSENLSERFCKCYGIALNALFRFLPVSLVVILNISIMCAIKTTSKKRRSLRSQRKSHVHDAEQRKVTIMLLVVSLTFLICILPGAINSLLQTIWKEYSRFGRSKNLQQCFSYVTFFLEVLNSSVNFIIYMALSSRFYIIFKKMFDPIKKCFYRICFRKDELVVSTIQEGFSMSRKSSFSYSSQDDPEKLANLIGDTNYQNDRIHNVQKNEHSKDIYNAGNKQFIDSDLFDKKECLKLVCLKKGPSQTIPVCNKSVLIKQDTLDTSLGDSGTLAGQL